MLPCLNEEPTIGKVIDDCRRALPEAVIYVFDNNSTDRSAAIAAERGARVVAVPTPGKGAVVRQMFEAIEAEVYVMIDADDTYEASSLPLLVERVKEGFDMVVGDRLSSTYYQENKRPFHNSGNSWVRRLVNFYFRGSVADIMTGYRAFSRRFAKSIELRSTGFQIETEMTIEALLGGYEIANIKIEYRDRPEGSASKLSTFKDGFKVLQLIFKRAFCRAPLRFFLPLVFLLYMALLVLIVLGFARVVPLQAITIPLVALGGLGTLLCAASYAVERRAARGRTHAKKTR